LLPEDAVIIVCILRVAHAVEMSTSTSGYAIASL
jgi:hypothetical protein